MSKKIENKVEKQEGITKKNKLSIIFIVVTVFLLIGMVVAYNFDSVKMKIFTSKVTVDEVISDKKISEIELTTMIDKKADKTSLAHLQEQLLNLQAIVNELILQKKDKIDISDLNRRIDNLQDLLIASVNGKADAQSVLGIVARIDKLETEVNRISRLNNEGSILLAATMLIKENALEGRDFSFETGILIELVGENSRISKPLQTIAEAAENGIATKEQLGKEFSQIYTGLVSSQREQETQKSWKERLNSKISELVTINKVNDTQTKLRNDFISSLQVLANDGKYEQIAVLIESSDNDFLKNDVVLQNWIRKVYEKQNFESAISKISAYSLSLMKLNNLLSKAE